MDSIYIIIGLLILIVIGVIIYYSRTISALNSSAVSASTNATIAQQKALAAQRDALEAAHQASLANEIAQQQKDNALAQQNAINAQKLASDAACKANLASADAASKQQCSADTAKALANAVAVEQQNAAKALADKIALSNKQCAADTADAVAKAKAEQLAFDQQNVAGLTQAAISAAVAAQQQADAADKANAVKQAIMETQNAAVITQNQMISAQASEYANKLQASVSAAVAAQKISDYTVLSSRPSKFLMQSVGANNLCLTFPTSGGPASYTACDKTGKTPGQIMLYDFATSTFRNQSGNCVDDGGVGLGNGKFYMANCYQMPNLNQNQTFHYWPDSSNIRNPYKNTCLDVNSGKDLYNAGCNATNKNQQWNLVPLL